MKLTNTDIISLVGSDAFGTKGALRELHARSLPLRDADRNIILDEKKQPVMEDVPYKFTPNTRSKLAIVLHKLFPHAQAFEEERVDLVREYKKKAREAHAAAVKESPDTVLDFTSVLDSQNPVYAEFNKELNKRLETEIDVESIPRFKIDDFAPDKNELPPLTLAGLTPILESTSNE